MTHNEPACFIGLGLLEGRHAPGDRLGMAEALRATHHTLLAHGKSAQVLRARAKRPPHIGLAHVGDVMIPATDRETDVTAARQEMFALTHQTRHLFVGSWWLDPIFFGRYPEDGWASFGRAAPAVKPGDMETIHQPLDFLGVNIYQGILVRQGADGRPERPAFPTGIPLTAFKWNVTPEALYWGPRFLYERYRAPIVVTENGMSGTDWISLDGQVHDPQRIDYTQRYLLAYEQAIADGVNARGYFHWTFCDNFEWAEGVKERFGLVYVDFLTQRRILKDSAHWFRQVIASNGACLHE
jgi:beta-glucosidase